MSAQATLLVTVLYNSEPVLDAWLAGVRQLCAESEYPIHLSVVDNASADQTVPRLRGLLRPEDPIRLTAHGENRGWGAGNNLALQAVADAPDLGPWATVVLLNPDVVLSATAHDAMRAVLDLDPDAGAVVPRLLDDAGKARVPAFPDYTLGDSLLGALGWRGMRSARWQRPRSRGTIADLRGGYAEGSCVMVRYHALQQAGPFDETLFMYFDDTDLTRRLRLAGYQLRYAPEITATDLPGKGSRTRLDRDEQRLDRYVHYLASELLYNQELYGHRGARWLARYKLWFDLPMRAILWRLRGHAPRGEVWRRCRPIIQRYLASSIPGSQAATTNTGEST